MWCMNRPCLCIALICPSLYCHFVSFLKSGFGSVFFNICQFLENVTFLSFPLFPASTLPMMVTLLFLMPFSVHLRFAWVGNHWGPHGYFSVHLCFGVECSHLHSYTPLFHACTPNRISIPFHITIPYAIKVQHDGKQDYSFGLPWWNPTWNISRLFFSKSPRDSDPLLFPPHNDQVLPIPAMNPTELY